MKWLILLLTLLCLSCGEEAIPLSTDLETDPVEAETTEEETEEETTAEDILPTETKVMVYYRHPLVEGIVPRPRPLFTHPNPAENIKQVIDLLSISPKQDLGSAIWPSDTLIRELYLLDNGTVVIDFDKRFVDSISAGATQEEFLVYSLVNTVLENFPDYKQVRLLVGGRGQETLLGHIDIEFPLKRSRALYTIVPEELPDEVIISNDLPAPEPLATNPKQEDLN